MRRGSWLLPPLLLLLPWPFLVVLLSSLPHRRIACEKFAFLILLLYNNILLIIISSSVMKPAQNSRYCIDSGEREEEFTTLLLVLLPLDTSQPPEELCRHSVLIKPASDLRYLPILFNKRYDVTSWVTARQKIVEPNNINRVWINISISSSGPEKLK